MLFKSARWHRWHRFREKKVIRRYGFTYGMCAILNDLSLLIQGGARGPGADNGLIFLKMCAVVIVVDLSVQSNAHARWLVPTLLHAQPIPALSAALCLVQVIGMSPS